MPESFDLCIRGGTLVDGTGAPARRGDVGIRDGRIAALGEVSGSAGREIDAEGLHVTPGFVDIHTHYDAQIFWDRMLSVSPWHGVTSVVMGNCGFGIAPTRPEHRDLILRTLENVEGMSLSALRQGLGDDWPFESFAQYLDAIDERGTAVNVAALAGHTPLRMYVMGEESTEREASDDEIAQMRSLLDESLAAGAIGFATSKSPTHIGYEGRPVPSRAAALAEIEQLAEALSAAGHGTLQATIGRGFFMAEMAALQQRIGRPISWTALLGGMLGPWRHRGILEQTEKLHREGVDVWPQVSCRPLMFEFQWKAPFPFESMPLFQQVSKADLEGRKRIYAGSEFREPFKKANARWEQTVISACAAHPELEERSVAEVATERGVHPVDLVLDLGLESDLEDRFRMGVFNTDDRVVAELLSHPDTMLGLSDAGAHASQLCDAGAPTTLLGKWVREEGVLALEEAVRQLTSQPADVFGLADRGRLAEGAPADVCVFDLERVDCGPVRRVHDFPGGADRLVADAHGIEAVVVNGTLLREQDRDVLDPEGELPGRVLRGGRD